MIERKEYLNTLLRWRDKHIIKVVTGIRRCGKSTLLEMYQDALRGDGVEDAQIIAVNLEDYANMELREPKVLHDYIVSRAPEGKKCYLFLDEIQNVQGFQSMIDSLFLRKHIDIYITGSNAYMLSGELATFLSGRYITIEMLPLSFAEYVRWAGDQSSLSEKYRQYLQTSSFPYVTELGHDTQAIGEYLEGIYSTVVLKDVLGRLKSAEPMMLESILRFVLGNVGSILSTKKISDTLTSEGRKIDVRTVEKYMKAFMDSYIIYRAKRFDVKGKQHLKTLEKYYVVDIGLRYTLLGRREFDVGHVLENVVFLELLRRGYAVYIGRIADTEIDFIATNQTDTLYFQVAASVRDTNTLERELRPLKQIRDNYPKMILTLDDDPDADYNGILRTNALQWLVSE